MQSPSTPARFLPEDVRRTIFTLLGARDLLSCARVCRSWRSTILKLETLDLADLTPGTFQVVIRRFPPSLKSLSCALVPADDNERIRSFSSSFSLISALSGLRSLSFCWNALHKDVFLHLAKLPHLTELTIRLTVMYNADFIPSVELFRRLKVLTITGLPMRENLRVYFYDHHKEYEKFSWNGITLKPAYKDAFEERRRGLLAEFRAPEQRQFGLGEPERTELATLLANNEIDWALHQFLSLHLDEIDKLKALFFPDMKKSEHPAVAILHHASYFQALLRRAQTCDRYGQVARDRFASSVRTMRTVVGVSEGARNILLWAGDLTRVLLHYTPIEEEENIRLTAAAAEFLLYLLRDLEDCSSEFPLLRQFEQQQRVREEEQRQKQEEERCVMM